MPIPKYISARVKLGSALVCPSCDHRGAAVADSRVSEDSKFIRRRRICLGCEHRWTTYEISQDQYYEFIELERVMKRIGLLADKSREESL